MANYRMRDARYTAIFVRETPISRPKQRFVKVPFELVRFNVDVNPEAEQVIVPDAQRFSSPKDVVDEKIYENIWFVDRTPFHVGSGGKHDFGKRDKEGPQAE